MLPYSCFDELKRITDEVYSGKREYWAKDVLLLLGNNDIKLRQDDGKLCQVNFSIPISQKDSFVLGLRYVKRDNTFTEDHFLFEKNQPIKYFSGLKLEKLLTEYKGTHKKQLVPDNVAQWLSRSCY
jgi:hypothetical protein